MKKTYYLLIFCMSFNMAFSQVKEADFKFYNPSTDTYLLNEEAEFKTTQTNTKEALGKQFVTCNPNSFFEININGDISEYLLLNDSVHFQSVLQTGTPYRGLAYCNNLSGGFTDPSFYSSQDTFKVTYFNDPNWIVSPQISGTKIYNPGGSGDNLYFVASSKNSTGDMIIKYDGNTFLTIYYDSTTTIAAGDLSVDDDGNIWFPIQIGDPSWSDSYSDSIRVINSLGQQIKSYYFEYNCFNIYGTFLLNSKLYLGVGWTHPTDANTLLPVSFSGDSAIIEEPIMMSPTTSSNRRYDLASCNQGLPLNLTKEIEQFKLFVYPNPFNNQFMVNYKLENATAQLMVFNMYGKLVSNQVITKQNTLIDLSNEASGIYFVQITDGATRITKKMVKQ